MRRALSIAAAVVGMASLLLSVFIFVRPFAVTLAGRVEACGLPVIYMAPNGPPRDPAPGEYEAWRECRRRGTRLAGTGMLTGLVGVTLTSVGWITLLIRTGPRRPTRPAPW